MSAEYFEEQRRQMIAEIRANTDQIAAQICKAALDKRVLSAMPRLLGQRRQNCETRAKPNLEALGPQSKPARIALYR